MPFAGSARLSPAYVVEPATLLAHDLRGPDFRFYMEGDNPMQSPSCPPAKVELTGNVKIITFTGSRIRRDIENAIAQELEGQTDELGESHLLLDFSNVESISSVELGTLITLHKSMKASGGRLTLFNLSAAVFEVFTVTRLQTLLGICREDSPSTKN
jgi:anti-anti-sigma factor